MMELFLLHVTGRLEKSDVNYFVFRKSLSNVLNKQNLLFERKIVEETTFTQLEQGDFYQTSMMELFLRKYLTITVVVYVFKKTPSLVFDRVLNTSGAVAQRYSVKKVFLEISRNSQENTCAWVSFFNKVAGLRPATLLKKSSFGGCL